LFSESQLFSLLRIIQNYENRRDIFREGCRFNRVSNENRHFNANNDNDVEILEEAKAIELTDRFDQNNWNDFLNQISKRVAESFVRSDVDF
jgi:hypothetical protein